MEHVKRTSLETSRIARHRKKLATSGGKRVEVTVPFRDAPLVKALAIALRSEGEEARRIRQSLQQMLSVPTAQTGQELLAFFRSSPVVGTELQVERDRSVGRSTDLG